MITWLNTPFEDVIQATKNLYGDINCEILIDPELATEEECYGMTQWIEDGRVLITLDGRTSIERLIEILGHELAHVVVDRTEKDDHGQIWEEVFDNIFKEYNRYCERKYSDKNQKKVT